MNTGISCNNGYGRTRVTYFFLAGILSIGISLNAVDGAAATTSRGENTQKLRQLQKEITETQNNLKYADEEKTRLHQQLHNAELKLAANYRQQRFLQGAIGRLERELVGLRARREQLKQSGRSQLRQLNDEVAIAYRLGQQEPIKLLLNIEDPQALNRSLKYYDYFLAARTEELSKYRLALTEISDISGTITTRHNKLSSERKALGREQARLQANRKQREQLLAKFQRQYTDENTRLKKLLLEKNHLQSVIEAVQFGASQNDAATPFSSQKGKLPWPVAGRLVSAFGDKRASSLRWSGWLLHSAEGSAVRAIYPGTVVFSDYLRGHGLLVIIDHGDGYLSLYAHNQSLTRSVGERVERGTTVARVGSSGGIRRSALYFEIRHQGKAVNPKPWLRRQS